MTYKTPFSLLFAGLALLVVHWLFVPSSIATRNKEPFFLYTSYVLLTCGGMGLGALVARDLAQKKRDSHAAWLAKEKEKKQNEHRSRSQQESERQRLYGEDQKRRRLEARKSLDLFYHRHVHFLNGWLTKKKLEEYVKKYMGDEHTAEVVEARSLDFQKTVLDRIEEMKSTSQKAIDEKTRKEAEKQRQWDEEQLRLKTEAEIIQLRDQLAELERKQANLTAPKDTRGVNPPGLNNV